MIKLNIKTLTDIAKIVILALVLGVGTGYVFAINWTAPTDVAPACSSSNPACHTPINVSTFAQDKAGSLSIGGHLVVASQTRLEGLTTANGGIYTPTAFWLGSAGQTGQAPKASGNFVFYNDAYKPQPGHVLTAIDTKGTAAWKIPTGGSGGVSGQCPNGQFMYGIQTNGTFSCWPAPHAKQCPAGQYMTGIDSAANPICSTVAGGTAKPTYYVISKVLDRTRDEPITVEKCSAATGDYHNCDTLDCAPNNNSSTGYCKDITISNRRVNYARLGCNPGDIAVSASYYDNVNRGRLTAVTPVQSSDGTPYEYECKDIGVRGGLCIVTCLKNQ